MVALANPTFCTTKLPLSPWLVIRAADAAARSTTTSLPCPDTGPSATVASSGPPIFSVHAAFAVMVSLLVTDPPRRSIQRLPVYGPVVFTSSDAEPSECSTVSDEQRGRENTTILGPCW